MTALTRAREAFSRLSMLDVTLIGTAVILAAALCGNALTTAAENARLRAETAELREDVVYWHDRYLDRAVAAGEWNAAFWREREKRR